MPLPKNFQFSQGSLQDFVDCERRFQLKYIEQLAWPAVEVQPAMENENYLQQGSAFHQFVQQYLLGVPVEKLSALAARDVHLSRWWKNFLDATENTASLENLASSQRYPEISLSTPIGDDRLVGKFDLLTVVNNQFTIYDWKTARKHPKRAWVAKNLQTRVYPYLLANAGATLNTGKSIDPDQIVMMYWYANFPTAPLRFPYSQAQFEEDGLYLQSLISTIANLPDTHAEMTTHKKRCNYCVYRSLCDRGIDAGPLTDLEDDETDGRFDFDLDFEQIAEIAFS
jgi:hypothetical protein